MFVLAGFVSQFLYAIKERCSARGPGGVIPLQSHDHRSVLRDTNRKVFNHRDAGEGMVAGVEFTHQCRSLNAENRVGLVGTFLSSRANERAAVDYAFKRLEVENKCGLLG